MRNMFALDFLRMFENQDSKNTHINTQNQIATFAQHFDNQMSAVSILCLSILILPNLYYPILGGHFATK